MPEKLFFLVTSDPKIRAILNNYSNYQQLVPLKNLKGCHLHPFLLVSCKLRLQNKEESAFLKIIYKVLKRRNKPKYWALVHTAALVINKGFEVSLGFLGELT